MTVLGFYNTTSKPSGCCIGVVMTQAAHPKLHLDLLHYD